MLGLMSPVEDPKLNDMLPKEVILRKVSEVVYYVYQCSTIIIVRQSTHNSYVVNKNIINRFLIPLAETLDVSA